MIPGLLLCPMFKLIDNTKTEWTAKDQAALVMVTKEGCKKRNPLEPCLYIFEKVKDGEYNAQCGPEVRDKKQSITDEK